MTSAVGWGTPNSTDNLHEGDSEKVGGGPKFWTFCGRHIWMVPNEEEPGGLQNKINLQPTRNKFGGGGPDVPARVNYEGI